MPTIHYTSRKFLEQYGVHPPRTTRPSSANPFLSTLLRSNSSDLVPSSSSAAPDVNTTKELAAVSAKNTVAVDGTDMNVYEQSMRTHHDAGDEYDKTSRRERDNISPTNVIEFPTSSNTHFSISEMVKRRKSAITSVAGKSSLDTISTRKVGAYDGKSSAVGDNTSDSWDRPDNVSRTNENGGQHDEHVIDDDQQMQTVEFTKKRKGSMIVSSNDNVNTKKGRKLKTYSTVDASTGQVQKNGRWWTENERALFLEGLQRYGRSKESWRKIATTLVKTRTADQIRGYADRYFRKQAKTVCHNDMSRLTDKVGVGNVMDKEDEDKHDLQKELSHDMRPTEVPEKEEQPAEDQGASMTSSSISTLAVVTSSNSNHDSQNMNTVTFNEHQTSITTKRITASNKVSYKDLDDKSISKMMSIDDADAIEKAERAKKSGVDTDMQQRIALARANSGYIALPEKQTNRRTTNNSKRAQTSPTAPLLLEHTKRRTQNPAKVVFDVEKAPPRPSYIASKSELDEATSVQKGDNDSDEDSCDRTRDNDSDEDSCDRTRDKDFMKPTNVIDVPEIVVEENTFGAASSGDKIQIVSGKSEGRGWSSHKRCSTVNASTGQVQNTGQWTENEHALFLEGLQRHGSSIESWTKIATTLVKTRTAHQIRLYARRHRMKTKVDNTRVGKVASKNPLDSVTPSEFLVHRRKLLAWVRESRIAAEARVMKIRECENATRCLDEVTNEEQNTSIPSKDTDVLDVSQNATASDLKYELSADRDNQMKFDVSNPPLLPPLSPPPLEDLHDLCIKFRGGQVSIQVGSSSTLFDVREKISQQEFQRSGNFFFQLGNSCISKKMEESYSVDAIVKEGLTISLISRSSLGGNNALITPTKAKGTEEGLKTHAHGIVAKDPTQVKESVKSIRSNTNNSAATTRHNLVGKAVSSVAKPSSVAEKDKASGGDNQNLNAGSQQQEVDLEETVKNASKQFIARVKQTLTDNNHPNVYQQFLDLAMKVKKEELDTITFARRVLSLFKGYNELIMGFFSLLPDEQLGGEVQDVRNQVSMIKYVVAVTLEVKSQDQVAHISNLLVKHISKILESELDHSGLGSILHSLHLEDPRFISVLPTVETFRAVLSACYQMSGNNPKPRIDDKVGHKFDTNQFMMWDNAIKVLLGIDQCD